jgi:hypothetical protein
MAYRSRVAICVPDDIAAAMQNNIGKLPKRLEKDVLTLLKQEFRKNALIPPCFLHNSRLLPSLFM